MSLTEENSVSESFESVSGEVQNTIWMLEPHPLPEQLSGGFVRLAEPRVTERLACSHLGLTVGREEPRTRKQTRRFSPQGESSHYLDTLSGLLRCI